MVWLLLSLVVLLLFYPVTTRWGWTGVKIYDILFSLIIFVTLFVLDRRAKFYRTAVAAFAFLAAAHWVNVLALQLRPLAVGVAVGWFGFYVYAVVTILGRVLRSDRVTVDEISGAISVYILIGLFFAGLYAVIYWVAPASFYIDPAYYGGEGLAGAYAGQGIFTLFSFETLTTLGYGDITPVSTLTRTLATLEAVTGVIYVAVLIASLVGISIYQRLSARPSGRTDCGNGEGNG